MTKKERGTRLALGVLRDRTRQARSANENKPTETMKDMKTMIKIARGVECSGLTLAAIFVAILMTAALANAQYRATGDDGITASPKLRAQLNERRTSATPASTTLVTMACAKCKDGWVAVGDTASKGSGARTLIGQTTRLIAKHLCDGCGAEWNVAGTGKGKQAVASHKCTACGAENLACCSGMASGTMATKGMDQKIQVAPLK
jgi:hypothetical protein